MKWNFEVIVVGAGVAGITAALYLRRADISCCIIDKDAPGGQINRTSTIENYPGLKQITGPELAFQMWEQINDLKVQYQYGNVIEIIDKKDHKIVKTETEEWTCKAVILALGRIPRKLGLPKEEELTGNGISWCAICDGPLYKGQEVAVVGGGNSALEESLYLATLCKKVTLIHRRDDFTAQEYLIDKVKATKNIKIIYSSEVQEYLAEDHRLTGLIVKNHKTDRNRKIKVTGCFLFIGYDPNTEILKNLGILDANGYIATDEQRRTKIPFIYAAGDVVAKDLFQIVTATSDGALVANSYMKDIRK